MFVIFVALKTEHERQLNEINERFECIKHSLSVRTSTHIHCWTNCFCLFVRCYIVCQLIFYFILTFNIHNQQSSAHRSLYIYVLCYRNKYTTIIQKKDYRENTLHWINTLPRGFLPEKRSNYSFQLLHFQRPPPILAQQSGGPAMYLLKKI